MTDPRSESLGQSRGENGRVASAPSGAQTSDGAVERERALLGGRDQHQPLATTASVASCGVGAITVVIGRFDAVVRFGLIGILHQEDAFRVLAVDVDDAALERVIAWKAPRLAILDEESVTSTALIERLRAIEATLAIVVLAHHPPAPASAGVDAARVACLAKSASALNLLAAFHLAVQQRALPSACEGSASGRSAGCTGLAALTRRELEVLGHLSRGQRHNEIAESLHITIETARKHSARIRSKLGVSSNEQLIGFPVPR